MGRFNDFIDRVTGREYARREQEVLDLARDFFSEQGVYKDDKHWRPDQEDFNPSDFDLMIYEKMLTDGQVKAGLDMIKLSATAKGFLVVGDDEETRQYADFINENLELIQGNIEDTLGEMLTALEYGYSATEKVFEYDKGKIKLRKLKVLNPHTITVKTNKFGDIEYIKQRVGEIETRIAPQKIMWFAHDKRFGNLYGQSALRTVYKHWFIKDKMYRFANIAYERYGTPLVIGTVQDAKDTARMQSLLEKINALSGFAISGGDDVKVVQGTNADFIGYIEHHDRKIMESMLVPPMLLGLSRGQSGSYALSGNQFDIFMLRIEALQRDIKTLLEEEVIRTLVDLNFPNAKKYPAVQFRPLANEDIEKMARVFQMMIQAQVVAPSEDWLREELGFPAMSEETKKEIEERKKASEALLRAQNGNTPNNDSEGSNEDSEGSQDDSEGK